MTERLTTMMSLKSIALAVLMSIAGITTSLANHDPACTTDNIEHIWSRLLDAPELQATRIDYGTEEKDRILSAAKAQGAEPGEREYAALGVVAITGPDIDFIWLFFVDDTGCITQDVKVSKDFWRRLIRVADLG